jgi:hypothetical protein
MLIPAVSAASASYCLCRLVFANVSAVIRFYLCSTNVFDFKTKALTARSFHSLENAKSAEENIALVLNKKTKLQVLILSALSAI